jgi:hypothetical protein
LERSNRSSGTDRQSPPLSPSRSVPSALQQRSADSARESRRSWRGSDPEAGAIVDTVAAILRRAGEVHAIASRVITIFFGRMIDVHAVVADLDRVRRIDAIAG